MKPYYDLLDKNENMDPAEAWERVKPQIESEVTYATWHRDFVAGGIGGGRGRFCSIGQIKCALPAACELRFALGCSTVCLLCRCLASGLGLEQSVCYRFKV